MRASRRETVGPNSRNSLETGLPTCIQIVWAAKWVQMIRERTIWIRPRLTSFQTTPSRLDSRSSIRWRGRPMSCFRWSTSRMTRLTSSTWSFTRASRASSSPPLTCTSMFKKRSTKRFYRILNMMTQISEVRKLSHKKAAHHSTRQRVVIEEVWLMMVRTCLQLTLMSSLLVRLNSMTYL